MNFLIQNYMQINPMQLKVILLQLKVIRLQLKVILSFKNEFNSIVVN